MVGALLSEGEVSEVRFTWSSVFRNVVIIVDACLSLELWLWTNVEGAVSPNGVFGGPVFLSRIISVASSSISLSEFMFAKSESTFAKSDCPSGSSAYS